MTRNSFLIAAFLSAVVFLSGRSALADESRFDVGLLLGSTRATNEGAVLTFDRATTYQATFASDVIRGEVAKLSIEIPFIASPAFTVLTTGNTLPLEYAAEESMFAASGGSVFAVKCVTCTRVPATFHCKLPPQEFTTSWRQAG
jgi:hypothetical protein